MYSVISLVLVILPFAFGDISNFDELYRETENLIQEFETYTFPVNNNEYFQPSLNQSSKDYGSYDFIIIGAGAAGGVLANRLTETSSSVLLLEAGTEDIDPASVVGLSAYFYISEWNWGYNTTPQEHSCFAYDNHQCQYIRGKILGGSSSIHGAMYVRGNAKDYDKWEEFGADGWSYNDVLPYFKKAERASFTSNIESEYHGFDGPQYIDVAEDTPELTELLLEGFKETGLSEVDYNGESQYGVSRMQSFLHKNVRASSAEAYIRPALSRQHLKLALKSFVTKIIFEDNRAVGIEFYKNGQLFFARAKKEVILSAGAINSPQILMLSGIGPAEELEKHNIKVIKDLPVGKFLQEHLFYSGLVYRTNHFYYNQTLEEQLRAWTKNMRPLTSGVGVQTVSFFNFDNDTSSQPDIEMFVPGPLTVGSDWGTVYGYNDEFKKIFQSLNAHTDFMVSVSLLHPHSIGEVTLASNDPRDFPLINTKYLSDERDLEIMYKGIQIALQLNNTEAFKNFNAQLLTLPIPPCDSVHKHWSKDWWYCALRHLAITIFHPIGTTRMGNDTRYSVVNSDLKVHGIEGLRVVDAGVIPTQVSGHTNAPVVMIAEKISDKIKAEYSP